MQHIRAGGGGGCDIIVFGFIETRGQTPAVSTRWSFEVEKCMH